MATDILVTGATGFVGRHLIRSLEVTGRTVYSHSSRGGDIARCDLAFNNVGHVFHLAAKSFVPDSWTHPLAFYETNVLGTLNVLEFCRRQRASLTLLSSYVYGEPVELPINEDHPVKAFNPYCQSKIMAEELARFYVEHHSVKQTIIRPFNLYGPGQDSRFLIPSLISQALDSESSTIQVTDSRPCRDYLYISDFIALLLATIDCKGGEVYNAGSGDSISVADLAATVVRVTGKMKPIVSEQKERPQEILDVRADTSKASADLQWSPTVTIEQGIRKIVALCEAQADKQNN